MSRPSDRLKIDHTRHIKERLIEAVLFLAAFVSVFTTTAIVYILISESWSFFQHVPLTDFLFDTQWTPLFEDAHYGIMVLLSGTITSSLVAILVEPLFDTPYSDGSSHYARFLERVRNHPVMAELTLTAEQWPATRLQAGDRLELLSFVGGG